MRALESFEIDKVAGGLLDASGMYEDYQNECDDFESAEGFDDYVAPEGDSNGTNGSSSGSASSASADKTVSTLQQATDLIKEMKSTAGADLTLKCSIDANSDGSWKVHCDITANIGAGGKR